MRRVSTYLSVVACQSLSCSCASLKLPQWGLKLDPWVLRLCLVGARPGSAQCWQCSAIMPTLSSPTTHDPSSPCHLSWSHFTAPHIVIMSQELTWSNVWLLSDVRACVPVGSGLKAHSLSMILYSQNQANINSLLFLGAEFCAYKFICHMFITFSSFSCAHICIYPKSNSLDILPGNLHSCS